MVSKPATYVTTSHWDLELVSTCHHQAIHCPGGKPTHLSYHKTVINLHVCRLHPPFLLDVRSRGVPKSRVQSGGLIYNIAIRKRQKSVSRMVETMCSPDFPSVQLFNFGASFTGLPWQVEIVQGLWVVNALISACGAGLPWIAGVFSHQTWRFYQLQMKLQPAKAETITHKMQALTENTWRFKGFKHQT